MVGSHLDRDFEGCAKTAKEKQRNEREGTKDAILHGAADGDRKEKKTCRSSGDSGTAIMEGQAGRQVGSTAMAGG